MKSIKDISWNVNESTYRADDALSYSTVAKFYREGFGKLDSLFEKEESQALTFGSLVDCLLTNKDEFEKKYFVCTVPMVNDEQKMMIHAMKYDMKFNSLYDLTDSKILEYLNRFDIYQNNWKVETKANKIRESCEQYYKMLISSNGRTVVPKETANDAHYCVEALKNSDATKYYFSPDNSFDGIERVYQSKFKGDYNGIPLKCMPDLLICNHKLKTIIPCDVKTSGEEEYLFARSFLKWGYFIQAGLYSYLIKQNLKKDDYFKDFTLLDYRFIVVCNRTRNPLVWSWSNVDFDGDFIIKGKTRDIVIPDWKNILVQLNSYIKDRPSVPIGIDDKSVNSIESSFKDW